MLTRRPTDIGFGPIPDDYSIRDDGRPVGRIYKAVNVTKDPWAWFINGEGYRAAKGIAGSLEEALAALKAEWERQGSRAAD